MIVGLLLAQLGAEVVRRADDCVCEIRSLIQHLRHTEVPNLDLVLFGQEHVYGLDVSVQNLVSVQVLNAEAHLKEESPYGLLRQALPHLPLQVQAKVAILAVLHDDVNVVLLSEGIMILHDVRTVHPCKDGRLVDRLLPLPRGHLGQVYLLEHVDLLIS